MRFIVDVRIECADRLEMAPVPIGVIDRSTDTDPASGLGLLLQEAEDLTQRLQTVVVAEHARQFVDAASKRRYCRAPLGNKDTKQVVYRTVFGVARLNSPRLYSRCSECGMLADSRPTFSPLAQALPERTHPLWTWLQCRYASVQPHVISPRPDLPQGRVPGRQEPAGRAGEREMALPRRPRVRLCVQRRASAS